MIIGENMVETVKQHLDDYVAFKDNIPVASSQMLRIMSNLEIEMITKDILSILDKKYKLEPLPSQDTIQTIITSVFENSIIRSDSELRRFLDTTTHQYETLKEEEIIPTIEQEFEDLTGVIKNIYNKEQTSCYADFPRRTTEMIAQELKSTCGESYEVVNVKLKMQLKKELTKVLQKFLDGAYKTIHTQILMNMKHQIDEVKMILK